MGGIPVLLPAHNYDMAHDEVHGLAQFLATLTNGVMKALRKAMAYLTIVPNKCLGLWDLETHGMHNIMVTQTIQATLQWVQTKVSQE